MPYYNSIAEPSPEVKQLMNRDDDVGSFYYEIYQGQFAQPNQQKVYTIMTTERNETKKTQEYPLILIAVLFGVFFAF
jgi:hypothetical protein